MAYAIDRQGIIQNVLRGLGTPLSGNRVAEAINAG